MVRSMTPVAVARATFSCSLCSHAAGAVELVERNAPGSGLELLVTGFGAPQRVAVEAPVAGGAVAALGAVDPKALFEVAPLAAPFYCPECDRVLCSHHWVSL